MRWGGVRRDWSRGAPQEQGVSTYSKGGVGWGARQSHRAGAGDRVGWDGMGRSLLGKS